MKMTIEIFDQSLCVLKASLRLGIVESRFSLAINSSLLEEGLSIAILEEFLFPAPLLISQTCELQAVSLLNIHQTQFRANGIYQSR
jgi:hypothetical protein